MARQSCTIGIDLGTTSVKAIAFDANMHEVSSAAQNIESRHDDAGAAEQDPRTVYQAATDALSQAAQQAQQRGYTVERVGLSAAMHSLLPVAADGTCLAPASTWMDLRARKVSFLVCSYTIRDLI